jgi:threonine/homoserine/homoserine lactone efflux protein
LCDETPFLPLASDILRDWAAHTADAVRSGTMIEHTTFPIDPVLFYTFLIAAVLIEITPGPNMAYLVTLAVTRGRAAGLATVAGITLGLAVYMVAAVFGLTGVFLLYRPAYDALRLAGVAYLLWLAVDAWRGADGGEADDDAELSCRQLAMRGFLINILNPKAAVFYIALLPSFIQAEHAGPRTQALLLGSVHIAISIAVHLSLVLLAVRLGGFVASGTGGFVLMRRIFAVLLAGVAVWLTYETRAV